MDIIDQRLGWIQILSSIDYSIVKIKTKTPKSTEIEKRNQERINKVFGYYTYQV